MFLVFTWVSNSAVPTIHAVDSGPFVPIGDLRPREGPRLAVSHTALGGAEPQSRAAWPRSPHMWEGRW